MKIPLQKIIIFWFRRDLRIEDNTGLHYSLQYSLPVLPLFIFDTEILDELTDRRDARVQFIHNQISHLYAQFKGAFLVKHGHPKDIFKQILLDFPVKAVFTNHDYEPYAIQRDTEIANLLQAEGVEFHTFKDQVIFEKSEILSPSGDPYKVFTPYKKRWLERLERSKLHIQPSNLIVTKLLDTSPLPLPTLEDLNFLIS